MNTVSIILIIIIAAAVVFAAVRSWKNRGRCGGCNRDCEHCSKKI